MPEPDASVPESPGRAQRALAISLLCLCLSRAGPRTPELPPVGGAGDVPRPGQLADAHCPPAPGSFRCWQAHYMGDRKVFLPVHMPRGR